MPESEKTFGISNSDIDATVLKALNDQAEGQGPEATMESSFADLGSGGYPDSLDAQGIGIALNALFENVRGDQDVDWMNPTDLHVAVADANIGTLITELRDSIRIAI